MESSEGYDLIITGGTCVTASDIAPWDIAVKNEKIVLLAPSGSLKEAGAAKIIDAEGGYVMVSKFFSSPRRVIFLTWCNVLKSARWHRLSCSSPRAKHVWEGQLGR